MYNQLFVNVDEVVSENQKLKNDLALAQNSGEQASFFGGKSPQKTVLESLILNGHGRASFPKQAHWAFCCT